MGKDQVELLNELTELDEAVRRHTKELVWLSAIALLGGALSVSLPLVIGGIAGGAAAWAMRHRKLAWVGAASVVAISSLTAHAVLRDARPWDATGLLDLALIVALVVDLVVATWALIRYRKADTAFQQRAASRPAEA